MITPNTLKPRVSGRTTDSHSKYPGGFTIVELLVIIALIGLLVTMLLPGMTNARKLSQQVSCLANEHQLSIGFSGYLADFQDKYPYIQQSATPITTGSYLNYSATTNQIEWMTNLCHYLNISNYKQGNTIKQFMCPSNEWPAYSGNGGAYGPPSCYAMNTYTFPTNYATNGDPTVSSSFFIQPRKQGSLIQPAHTLLLGEVPNSYATSNVWGWTFWTSSTGYDPFINPGYWLSPEIAARVNGGNPEARVNHNIAWNSLMCDGSAKLTSRATLYAYCTTEWNSNGIVFWDNNKQ